MCGIFGGVGNYDPNKIALLAILNENRGKDSAGFWNGSHFVKATGLARDLLMVDMVAERKTNFIMGHTRAATIGEISKKNAHPFEYGKIVGMHNGVVRNFEELKRKHNLKKMKVDSEVIFWGLDQHGIKFLKELEAYWGLSWTNQKDSQNIYLSRHGGQLAMAKTEDAIYYSSDSWDLEKVGFKKVESLTDDSLYMINHKTLAVSSCKLDNLKGAYRWSGSAGSYSDYWEGYNSTSYPRSGTGIEQVRSQKDVSIITSARRKPTTYRDFALIEMMVDTSALNDDEEMEYLVLDQKFDTCDITIDEADRWMELEGRRRLNKVKEIEEDNKTDVEVIGGES